MVIARRGRIAGMCTALILAGPASVCAVNIDAGTRHLRSLLDRFDVRLALAAYNAGEAAVKRFGGVPPYRDTQTYVARVLSLVARHDR